MTDRTAFQRARRGVLLYAVIVMVSIVAGATAFEIFLAYRSKPREPLPFYNRLYPYVMFRPYENAVFETKETYEMSHHRSRVFVYTNEDGFRIPSPKYALPKNKPANQFRVAFLGGSLVQLASTFDTTLPGSLKTVLQERFPKRDIEVINAGIQSSVSRQSLVQLLLDVVDYHPDLVILYDGGNDLGLPLTYESRPNFPYNFQTMQDAWDEYRSDRRSSLPHLILDRSYVYRFARAKLRPSERDVVRTADEPFAGTNAVPPERVVEDKGFAPFHVTQYLTNWEKLIALSHAYGFKPVCILSPAGGLDRGFAIPRMMQAFHLTRSAATKWSDAFDVLYSETGRQIEAMRPKYPEATLIDLATELRPSEKYFWDLAHVYDEVNLLLARRILRDIEPMVSASLATREAAGRSVH